jgi:phosphohistidine phosphatase SixA
MLGADMKPNRCRGPRAPGPLTALIGLLAIAAIGASVAPGVARGEDAGVVDALRAGGVAVLLRHSQTTPGVGDPPGWKLANCSSQRNLDDQGRAQAKRIGAWFKKQKIAPTVVRNSPWCRTRDTAQLAFGRTQDWPPLANLFNDPGPTETNTEKVLRYIAGLRPGDVAVLVSHGSSISAFVGEHVGQGEAVVVRAKRGAKGRVETVVVGRIVVP